MHTFRRALVAAVLLTSIAGGFTGVALSGETDDVDRQTVCADATWPMIPAVCLKNGPDHDVRRIMATNRNLNSSIAQRFDVAFH